MMDNLWRHWIFAVMQTKSGGKRFIQSFILISICLVMIACGVFNPSSDRPLMPTPTFPPMAVALTPTPNNGQPAAQPTAIGIQPTQPSSLGTGGAPEATPDPDYTPSMQLYYSQSGDTLPSLARRFGVLPDQITSPEAIPSDSLLNPGQLLIIPDIFEKTSPSVQLLPDSEIVFSPSAVDFDVTAYVNKAGGYLSEYRQELTSGWLTGAQVIERVAIENSVNPRLLLTILEVESGWVYGKPGNLAQEDYPLGWKDFRAKGLYKQLSWAVQYLSIGYYGWRAGILTDLTFPNGEILRISPDLNAGSVALQVLFSKLHNQDDWNTILFAENSLPALHEQMFGNPWVRAQSVEPLYPPNLKQPALSLPFTPGHTWALTGGPHSAWGPDGALAAVDFAPMSITSGCVISDEWIVSSAPGLVVRAENGAVLVDLDGDGREQTGWVLLYMHVGRENRVNVGTFLDQDDLIGHPSCEGGVSTGTHVHFARKYNGEWILADGPMPLDLNGWVAHAGVKPYEGTMTKGEKTVYSSVYGSFESRIKRENGEVVE